MSLINYFFRSRFHFSKVLFVYFFSQASLDQLLQPQAVEETADDEGLFTSRLTLRFSARPYHFFLGGRLRVQCEAIISQAHTLRSEEIIITNSGTTTATGAYGKYI